MKNATRMHVALNVADLDRSVAFYTTLFDQEPSKVRADYAKFDLEDPALVFSLNPGRSGPGSKRLSHLGFRVDSIDALETARGRLAEAGLVLRDEHQTTCCYSVQNKFWVKDPDGNEWEIYEWIEDAEVHSGPEPTAACCVPGS